MRRQELVRFERGHAAQTGGGDGLAIGVVCHVARGVNAGDVRLGRAGFDDDVAVVLHRQLTLEQFSRRGVADGDEHPIELALFALAGFQVLDDDAGDAFGLFHAGDVFERRVPDHFDLGMREQALLQHLLGAQ